MIKDPRLLGESDGPGTYVTAMRPADGSPAPTCSAEEQLIKDMRFFALEQVFDSPVPTRYRDLSDLIDRAEILFRKQND